ncbi:MAG: lamin tail domain-containing protein [Chitinophagales bacterium]|nr:lamin tail domain-containing protein [Chitinophagales bacterium]MDW8394022.1 lamin tail domain-containing protein [Chitinophagales bacterium]
MKCIRWVVQAGLLGWMMTGLPLESKAQPCSDLFISEYIEGTSFNKAIEIYNPTSGTLTLDGYRLYTFNNGSPVALFTHGLHGQLGPGQVYVVCHPQADSLGIKVKADTISLVCNWNGNDAVALVNTYTGDTIDVIGIIGEDPGTSWPVDVGSTQNSTLVRKPGVQAGTTNWAQAQYEYLAYGTNDFSFLGAHQMDPCPFVPPSILFLSDTVMVSESDGIAEIIVGIVNPNANVTGFSLLAAGGTATSGDDFSLPAYIAFPGNSSQPLPVGIAIVNDNTTEPDETVYLELINPTNGASVIGGQMLLIIQDDDALGMVPANNSEYRLFRMDNSNRYRLYLPDEASVQIADAGGSLRLGRVLNAGFHVLDLDGWADGIYLLAVTGQRGRMVERIAVVAQRP